MTDLTEYVDPAARALRAEGGALCHPGATQSPDWSQGATQGLRGPESAVPRLLADRERLMDAPPVFPSRTRHHVVPPVRQSLPDTLAGGGFSEEFTEHLGALAIHHRKYGEHILGLGITCPCLPTIALSAVPHLETAPLPDTSDVRSVSPARDAVTLDYDEASRVPALLADKAALMGERDRLRAERDRARGTAATLEAENARLREGIERLCSDIDNPLRERHDESPHDLPEVAEDLRALLADTDSAQDEGGE